MKETFLSLKENITMVKEELNSEEKFFEKAVITEKFVKKYKKMMIASVVAVVVLVVANIGYEANEASKKTAANELLAKLISNPSDKISSSKLHTLNPALYDAWIFSQASVNKDLVTMKELKNSKTFIISDLAKYELANDVSSLDSYASKQDAIYKDLALVQSAVILLNENKIDEAHNELVKVSKKSPLSKIATALMHYGLK